MLCSNIMMRFSKDLPEPGSTLSVKTRQPTTQANLLCYLLQKYFWCILYVIYDYKTICKLIIHYGMPSRSGGHFIFQFETMVILTSPRMRIHLRGVRRAGSLLLLRYLNG